MYYKLKLTQPPTLNQTIYQSRIKSRNAAAIANAQKQKWTARIASEVKELNLLPFSEDKMVYVFGEFFPATLTSDSDNMLASLKYVYDGLKKSQLIKDDSIKYLGKISHFVFKRTSYFRGEAANKIIMLHLTDEFEVYADLVKNSLYENQ